MRTWFTFYRPLTSIRFFRLLCLALYGPNRDVNSIVHRNGLYDRRFSTENMLKGIEIQVDRIVVHKEGCENVLRIVREFIDELIAWYDQR